MEDEGLRRSLRLSSCLLFAQGGVLCHITCKWCGHSAQCWGCCPARRAVRSRKRLNDHGSGSALCISRTIAALLWEWRGAEEHACSPQVKTIRSFNFSAAATFSASVRNRHPRLCRCCSASARIPEGTFLFFSFSFFWGGRNVSQEGCQRQSSDQQPVCGQPDRERYRESCAKQPGHRSDERCGPSQQTVRQQQQRVLRHRLQGKIRACANCNSCKKVVLVWSCYTNKY